MARSSVHDKYPLPLVRSMDDIAAMAWEGTGYHVANPTMLTGVTGQTSHALTLATIYLGNRGAKAMVPLWARFSQAGTVAGGRIQYGMKMAFVDQFTSGTALTVEPLNSAIGVNSQVTAAHTATIPAFSSGNVVNVVSGELFQTVTAATEGFSTEFIRFPGCYVVNPGGALYIYTNSIAGAGPTWQFDVAWAELDVVK